MVEFDVGTVGSVYDFLSHESETEVRLIDPRRRKRARSVFVCSRADFLKVCRCFNGQYNVYVGINERRPGGRRGEDVLSVKVIVADLDAVRPDMSQPATDEELDPVRVTAERIAEASAAFWRYRPNVCMSGNGYQLWSAIPAIGITEENRDEVETRVKLFHRLVKGMYHSESVRIDSIGDLPRVVKVTGTLSIKGEHTEERPHRLSYCLAKLERREDPYLRQFILSLEPEQKKPLSQHAGVRSHPEFDVLLRRDQKLRRLFDGNISGYQSRSEAEMALMVKLVFYGFSQARIWEIMESSKIGKWQESAEGYRQLTYEKGLRFVRSR